MMGLTTIERVKNLKRLKEAVSEKQDKTGLALAKLLKEILDLRKTLGFTNQTSEPQKNPVFTQVIEKNLLLSKETLKKVRAEVVKDPTHPQIVPAVTELFTQYQAQQ